MTLYIIRHADPDYENNTITEFGWQEARALADWMKTVEHMIQKSDEFLASFGYVRQGLLYRIEKPCDESVAVFCHGGFGAAWIAHLIGAAPGLAHPSIKLGTSSVTTFSFLNTEKGFNRPVMRRMGEIHHIYNAGLRINTR